MPVSKLEGEAKPTASPKIKPDSEALTRNAPVLQPSIRTDEQKTPSEAMMEQKVESPVATGAALSGPFIIYDKRKGYLGIH